MLTVLRWIAPFAVGLLLSPAANADPAPTRLHVRVPASIHACFLHASGRRKLDLNLLLAIGKVESNYRAEVTNEQSNAIGVMQIMPFHLGWLKKYGIYERDLYDACTNINVASALLADFMRMYGGDTWRAVGAFGAGIRPEKERARVAYAQLVREVYQRLTQQPALVGAPPLKTPITVSVSSGRPQLVIQQ